VDAAADPALHRDAAASQQGLLAKLPPAHWQRQFYY
jgi:hypothetical protein